MNSKNGKLIAVWGSRDSGKTTLSVKLANELAKKQMESLIVLTDVNVPNLKCILPFEKEIKSMGNVWITQDADENAIYNACMVTPSEYICLMGYAPGENAFSYSDSTKNNVFKIYEEMKTMVDYVIVDCVPNLAYNMLTAVALEVADKVIRLGEADVQSFSFFDSSLALLKDPRFEAEEHIKVLGKVRSTQPVEAAASYLGCDVELPYVEEFKQQMMEGKLFDSVSSPQYNAGVTKLLDHLLKEE